jgi:hypothetical protein
MNGLDFFPIQNSKLLYVIAPKVSTAARTRYGRWSNKSNASVRRVLLAVVVPVVLPIAVLLAVPITLMEIPVVVAVPAVIMSYPAAISLPVTLKELVSIVMRCHPASPKVRWSSPITFMPPVTPSHRIPITIYPDELGAWPWR